MQLETNDQRAINQRDESKRKDLVDKMREAETKGGELVEKFRNEFFMESQMTT